MGIAHTFGMLREPSPLSDDRTRSPVHVSPCALPGTSTSRSGIALLSSPAIESAVPLNKAELKAKLEKDVDAAIRVEFKDKKDKVIKQIRDLEVEKKRHKALFTKDIQNKRRKLRREEEGKELKVLEGRRDMLRKEVDSWKFMEEGGVAGQMINLEESLSPASSYND